MTVGKLLDFVDVYVKRITSDESRCTLTSYGFSFSISIERLSINNSGIVPVVEYHHGEGYDKTIRTFSPLEFLAELSVHTPRVFEQTYRMYGIYSPRTRGMRRREEQHKKFIENNFQEPEYESDRKI